AESRRPRLLVSGKPEIEASQTRLKQCCLQDSQRSTECTRRSAFGVLLEEFHRIANGQDCLGGVIGNLAAELLLESHDKLDGVEAVGAQVVDETRGVRHLVGLHAKVLHDDLLYPLANVSHFSKPRAPLDWLGPSGDLAIAGRGIVVVDGSGETPEFAFC